MPAKHLHGLDAIAGGDHRKAKFRQHHAGYLQDDLVVIHQQHRAGFSGILPVSRDLEWRDLFRGNRQKDSENTALSR